VFGGSAEYVALSLKSWGETTFFWYVTVMGALAFVSLMLHRKGKGIRL
jgi:MHS family alpha-ketoglutarate permease-like MFS transporter